MSVGPIQGTFQATCKVEVGADLSAARGKALELGTEGKVTISNAAADEAHFGIATENASGTATSGLYIQTCLFGFCRGRAGGNWTIADPLVSSSDGELVDGGSIIKPAGSGAETLIYPVALCLDSTPANAGEFGTCLAIGPLNYALV